MRAANYVPKKIKFPVWAQPKIDGLRALNMDGTLTARTMKKHRNYHTTAFFSKPEYIGFDGELAAELETHPDLCRITSSACGSAEGEPFVLWHVFDFVTEETRYWPYSKRYSHLRMELNKRQNQGLCGHLRLLPITVCNNQEELDAAHAKHMEQGYEGTCFYGPDVTHKEGKSSPTHNGVLRIKDFIDAEAIVLDFEEGDTNNNEAQTNELGRTFRSSHKANKTPNGMIGRLLCKSLVDVFDLHDDKLLLIPKDSEFIVSPGKMSHKDRLDFFANPEKILQKIIKHKFFPKGIKDKPRFSNYQCIRSSEDMD
jgi:DNA ligase-1